MGPILAHQTAKFKLSGQFCFSRHPWGPWGRLSSGVICISKIYQLFCDSGAALADFFTFMKMLPNVSFISIQLFYRNSLFECIIMKHLNQKSVSVFFKLKNIQVCRHVLSFCSRNLYVPLLCFREFFCKRKVCTCG